ncbi:unnamed protein product [Rhizophagus irregularis]|nr:unnamed protein product [Rhizophagus irregularis]CAB4426158.1 unnamed protein product [Rhizophagus irregularis]
MPAVKKSKTAAAPKDKWRTIYGDWLEYRNINEKVLMFCTWCEGKINGVAAQLKKENPSITSVHCIAHRLAKMLRKK